MHFVKGRHDNGALSDIWCKTVVMLVSPDMRIERILIIILEAVHNFIIYNFKFCFKEHSLFAGLEAKGWNIA